MLNLKYNNNSNFNKYENDKLYNTLSFSSKLVI